MKYFRMSYEEVVFNRSYVNIMLLNRTIPSWNDKAEDVAAHNINNNNQQIKKSVHASDFFMDMMG